VKNFSWH